MLKTVAVDRLRPNPFRRLDEYPIIREKVDALKESIAQTGFWGTIVGRPKGQDVEIAFGHHRLVALQESGAERVEVIIRDLSNEDMLKMMARENMEEWGTSAWVELETVRATLEAFRKGEITLPAVPKNAPEKREVCEGSRTLVYTKTTVAEFLGWTSKAHKDGARPNFACETAFKALDMIDAGFIEEADLRGLSRTQLRELVQAQWSIYQAEMRVAKQNEEEAERASQQASKAAAPAERQRLEKQAAIHTEQAKTHKAEAEKKATAFGKQGAEMFRGGAGARDVRKRGAELKPTVERPGKIHEIDDLARRIAKVLEGIADGDDALSEDFKFLKANAGDLSERAAKGLHQSFAALIARLECMQDALTSIMGSHGDGTRNTNGRSAIGSRC